MRVRRTNLIVCVERKAHLELDEMRRRDNQNNSEVPANASSLYQNSLWTGY